MIESSNEVISNLIFSVKWVTIWWEACQRDDLLKIIQSGNCYAGE